MERRLACRRLRAGKPYVHGVVTAIVPSVIRYQRELRSARSVTGHSFGLNTHLDYAFQHTVGRAVDRIGLDTAAADKIFTHGIAVVRRLGTIYQRTAQ